MSSFPSTSFHFKNEQYRLSLLDNEEDATAHSSATRLSSDNEVLIGNDVHSEKAHCADIIAPTWKPLVPPPANHPSQEPRCLFYSLFNCLISTVLTLLFYLCLPVYSALYMLFGLCPNLIVQIILRFIDNGKFQLMPMSQMYGAVNGNNHTVMLICRGRCDIEKVRAHMNAVISAIDPVTRIGKFNHLQSRVTTKFGYLCLENRSTTFDIKNHVRHFDIRSKNVAISADDIIPSLESSYNQPFDNYLTTPQWEVLVIPKYVVRKKERGLYPQNRHPKKRMYALIFRFQSGIMGWNMMQELIVEFLGACSGRVKSIFCPSTKNIGIWKNIKIQIACLLIGPQALLWNILTGWGTFAGMKSLHEEGRISFATTKSLSSEAIEDIKDRTQVGMATILGSCVRIAVRNMALGQGLEFPKSISVARAFNSMNHQLPRIDWFRVNFKKYRNCMERLHASFHAIERKDVYLCGQRTFNNMMMHLGGIFPSRVSAWLYKILLKADVVLEIWPGPDEPCKLFDGDLLEDIYGWSGVTGIDSNFKVTVTSYCGRVRANVIGKLGQLSGSQTDAEAIAYELEMEYEHLASAVSLYPQQLYLSPFIDN